jgi:ATP-binding cassette subfamily B protein
VHSLSLETAFTHAFASESEKSLTEGVRATRLSAGLERTVDVLIAVATAVVLWYGARLAMRGALSPGDLLVFLAYLKQAFKPMKDFAKYTGRLAKAASAGERVIELLEREPDVRDLLGAKPAPAFSGHVVFERVSFAYEPDCPVLQHIAIEARPGERIAIVGPSGSGKSTLVGLLLRLFDPTRGRVTIDGHDIRDYTIASLRAQISVVLQDTTLFTASVRDNIALGAPAAGADEIEAAARLANAHEFIAQMPNGYDTPIGERGVTLSAGQRQRIAIARAAIRRAPILILDEATTGLDVERERAVIEALERLARGRTTFVVTHDLRQAATADVILFLDGGRIAERGTHEELMRAGARYASLYRLQDEPSARAQSRRTSALAV